MASGHGAAIVAHMAHRLGTIMRCVQDRLGADNTKVLVEAVPVHVKVGQGAWGPARPGSTS
eukprot:1136058-Alexandrium_andersonii.AAC.1